MATISSLPNELLIAIFSYVAPDARAGQITTTVGRVSKLFHNLVQSSGLDVLYASVRGFKRMQKFLTLIKSRNMAQKRVESLLLVVARNDDVDRICGATALSILEAVLSNIDASRLHTLFIHIFTCYGVPSLHLRVPLPSLTDLHLSGLVAVPPEGHPSPSPNIKHLQLLRLHELFEEEDAFPRYIHNIAPNILHLKLSVRTLQYRYFESLYDLIPLVYCDSDALANQGRTAFPDSLKQIVACLTYDCNNPIRVPEYPPIFTVLAEKLGLDFRERCEPAPLVVVLPEEGQQDYIPERKEADQGEAEFVGTFVRTWMDMNLGQWTPWSPLDKGKF
ncbi:hypothetical protein EIP91_008038 [Steccherinum ochraceum]|uniref:F-box domain-containing protein n=1 Tax=Steccherinum ochraceum TaxID=92696 RepID=A0A4V2MVA4_9APHY|nr:hypothetical protein EIP91_008038 [Steccherinum ochraceum]